MTTPQHAGNQVELNFSSGSEGEELLIKEDGKASVDTYPPLCKIRYEEDKPQQSNKVEQQQPKIVVTDTELVPNSKANVRTENDSSGDKRGAVKDERSDMPGIGDTRNPQDCNGNGAAI